MKLHQMLAAAGCVAGLLSTTAALADTSCASYWGESKRWWNDGANNNAWVARCRPGSINPEWVAEQSAKQYVVCLKFKRNAGLPGHVYEPTFTPPASLTGVPCRDDVEFSELLYKDCLTPEQPVRFKGARVPIADAARAGAPTVTALTAAPSIGGGSFAEQAIHRFVSTRFIGKTYLLRFGTGVELELTGNHPLVLGDGRMVQTETLNPGDAILRADGDIEPIVQISRKDYSGDVWNVRPVSQKKIENVLVVRDVLTGSAHFTERWAEEETRLVRSRTIDASSL